MSHAVDAHVGVQIRFYRIKKSWSQEELAKKVGVTYQQIQKYERGSNRVSASMLYELAAALGVSISEFFPPRPAGEPGGVRMSPPSDQAMQLGVAFDAIADQAARKQILGLVTALSRPREESAT